VNNKKTWLAAVCFLCWWTTPVSIVAHHSFAAEYDIEKPVKVTGIVTKMEWTNPHARLYVDVKGDSGAVSSWEFELSTPNGLMRSGWSRNALKAGDSVSVEGFAARKDPHVANARSVTLADGKKVFSGTAIDTQAR
jgi:hypothetical protein